MEKDKLFLNEDNTMEPTWNSSSFGMEIQSSELNCGSELPPYSFLNPNWDNSMDQGDPFESALSSMVSSPAASAAGIPTGSGGDGVVLRELIGRLGSICNSGEVSPQSYIGNNSRNTSCYSTPLNSPPKLNLLVMDQQIRGNFNFPVHSTLSPFSSDPGFAERAAKFSSFGSGNFRPQNGQFGLSDSDFPHRLTPRVESPGLVSRVSSNHQSSKVSVSPMDKKFSSLSKSSTPENTEFGDSREGSSVSEQISGGEIGMKAQNDANARKRKSIPRGKVKEIPSSSSAKDAKVAAENEESNAKKSKAEESENGKAGGDGNQKQTKDSSKPPEPPKDYIHVRARRGQATDSHSLAERVRREKISERMKFLQDLVPGCNKVTGKAVMLDEIINYVQSLQRQVEFLSMKLATVNPRMDFNMETFLSKDIFPPRGSVLHNTFPLETTLPAFPHGFQSPPQGPSLNIGIPNGTESFSMNSFNAALHRNPSMPLPPIDGFGEAVSQPSTLWEQDDLQSVVQMGFGQNQQQNLHGTMATAQMKVEL